MKKQGTVFVSIPADLLPDVVELVTDAYMKLQGTIEKNERTISDLQFELFAVKNKAKQRKEVPDGDDF